MNIAEGSARSTLKEYIHFLHIALGSIAELDTQLIISKNLNFIDDQAMLKLSNELMELSKMTSSLVRNLETRLPNSKPATPNP
ncbi:MAG TPA: four helix bundle protein [Candidatus Cloacimonadota bacterium]|nr:four helix bundle protein [Candidatus Cloacimonadota bacterium]